MAKSNFKLSKALLSQVPALKLYLFLVREFYKTDGIDIIKVYRYIFCYHLVECKSLF